MKLVEVAGDDAMLAICQNAYFSEISERFGVSFDPHAGESDDLSQARQWHVLAMDGEVSLGCGSLRDLGDGIGEVKRVWVSGAARGRGVAGQVMTWLEAKGAEAGFFTLRLDTHGSLIEAQAMYRKRGYREIVRYNDNPYAQHWFEKAL